MNTKYNGKSMKKLIVILLIALISTGFSQTLTQKIQTQLAESIITETEALYLEALSVHAPDKLPTGYDEFERRVRKSAFSLNYRLQKAWPSFNSEQQAALQTVLQRPVLQRNIISPAGLFRIHFDVSGPNSVALVDYNDNEIPDYVDEAADIMDYVYNVEISQLGLKSPPDDRNGGGTAEWDIYIMNVGNYVYGWTYAEYPPISFDPTVYTAYMVLDNDYTHTPTSGLDGFRVTAAHEFFHMVQLGYNGRDDNNDGWFDDLFLMEAGSTWMEDVVYDHINDYLNYLEDFFQRTDVRFDYVNGWREYGLCKWYLFLEERLGSREFISRTWDAIVDDPGMVATAQALEGFSTTFEAELPVFYGWNYFTSRRANTGVYYPEGDTYPLMVLNGYYEFRQDTSLTDTVNATAAKYYQFMEDNENTYTLIPTHIDLTPGLKKDGFVLALGYGEGWQEYVRLGDNMRTMLITDNPAIWSGTAVVEIPGSPAELVLLNDLYSPPVLKLCRSPIPNPFVATDHSEVHLPFEVEFRTTITLSVFSPSGALIFETEQEAHTGVNEVLWNGMNSSGEQVASGIYLYFISSRKGMIRKNKLVVIR